MQLLFSSCRVLVLQCWAQKKGVWAKLRATWRRDKAWFQCCTYKAERKSCMWLGDNENPCLQFYMLGWKRRSRWNFHLPVLCFTTLTHKHAVTSWYTFVLRSQCLLLSFYPVYSQLLVKCPGHFGNGKNIWKLLCSAYLLYRFSQ